MFSKQLYTVTKWKQKLFKNHKYYFMFYIAHQPIRYNILHNWY